MDREFRSVHNRRLYCRLLGDTDGNTPFGRSDFPLYAYWYEFDVVEPTSSHYSHGPLPYTGWPTVNRIFSAIQRFFAFSPSRSPSFHSSVGSSLMANPLPSTSAMHYFNGDGTNFRRSSGGEAQRNSNQWLAVVNSPIEQESLESIHSNDENTPYAPSPTEPYRWPLIAELLRFYDGWRANMDIWLAFDDDDDDEDESAPPLSEEKIKEIERVVVTSADVDQCSVCLENFRLSEVVLKLACSHMFHEHCIVTWLKLHDTCPKCRFSLGTENDDQQSDDEED